MSKLPLCKKIPESCFFFRITVLRVGQKKFSYGLPIDLSFPLVRVEFRGKQCSLSFSNFCCENITFNKILQLNSPKKKIRNELQALIIIAKLSPKIKTVFESGGKFNARYNGVNLGPPKAA